MQCVKRMVHNLCELLGWIVSPPVTVYDSDMRECVVIGRLKIIYHNALIKCSGAFKLFQAQRWVLMQVDAFMRGTLVY